MAEPIRYGVIGTGMMGCEHILNLALIPEARVTAIADCDETSLQWGRTAAGADVLVYRDYRALLREAPVDAVVVATPNFTHFDVLQDVFRTAKHVLIEKPLCTDLEQCRRVVDAAAKHPGVVWVGMEYRFMRPVARLVEVVRAGEVGRVCMIAIREHRFPFLPKVGNWNRFARNTGGTLVEKCCHFFDLMTLVARRRPALVYASGGQDVNHLDERYAGETPDILDNAFVVVDYDGGPRAMLDLCMFATSSVSEMALAVTGDVGKAEALLPLHKLVLTRRDRIEPEIVMDFALEPAAQAAGAHEGATLFEHKAFLEAIRTGGPPAVSAGDGAVAVAIGAAAERSVRERRPIELPELGF